MERAPVSPLRQWSAWLPIAISVFLIALGLRHAAIYGLGAEADEGTEAHLFQLLMPLQALVIAYFAVTWLPRAPRPALGVLALQLAAAAAVLVMVFRIEHP
jgi:MFS superfamily sulfate permease-like transporter